jgi:hypothetical protein
VLHLLLDLPDVLRAAPASLAAVLRTFTLFFGTVLAILGALALVPGAVHWTVQRGLRLVQGTLREIARLVRRVLRKSDSPPHTFITGAAGFGSTGTLSARAFAVDSNATPEQQLETLWPQLAALHTEVGVLGTELRARISELSERLNGLAAQVDVDRAAVRDAFERAEEQADASAANALPAVLAGLLLTVFPEQFSALPLPPWVLVVGVVTAVAGLCAVRVFVADWRARG